MWIWAIGLRATTAPTRPDQELPRHTLGNNKPQLHNRYGVCVSARPCAKIPRKRQGKPMIPRDLCRQKI